MSCAGTKPLSRVSILETRPRSTRKRSGRMECDINRDENERFDGGSGNEPEGLKNMQRPTSERNRPGDAANTPVGS
ncbi:hypothetical protein K0M31_014306 [Melipona bicolor]|uniref:Uncharacterized protein n=1 Tax=Melipona bicolor TaxID=60889 RepID=A0AA40G8A8_9HYME|nr:hypothetical protein K0M31_014306 [Melipona bicolor]